LKKVSGKFKMVNLKHHIDLPKRIKYALIITSDNIYSKIIRNEKFEDLSGRIAEDMIINSGNIIIEKIYLPNNKEIIREKIEAMINNPEIDVIIVSGGTGISKKDVSIEAISPIFEKTLPGFGELFRFLSYNEIGTSAIASRANAGIKNNKIIFLLPGSPDAVKLALEKIIIPEAPHLIKMIRE